jgi:hypothetical protein
MNNFPSKHNGKVLYRLIATFNGNRKNHLLYSAFYRNIHFVVLLCAMFIMWSTQQFITFITQGNCFWFKHTL